MKNEHQRETAFLMHCLQYGENREHRELQKEITQIQRDQRCVRRAVWMMALLAAMATAGFCYGAVLVDNFPSNIPHLVINSICALALASVICLVAFLGLHIVYRLKLERRREQCRWLVTKLLESRLGNPLTARWRKSRDDAGSREAAPVAAEGNGYLDKTEFSAQG